MKALEQKQLWLEERFNNNVNLWSIVKRELDEATGELLDWCLGTTSTIADWLSQPASYESKNIRKKQMRENLDLELLVIAIAVAILFPTADKFVFQIAIGKLSKWLELRLVSMDVFQLAITAAELLSLASNKGLFEIDKDRQPFEIQRFMDLSPEDRSLIEPTETEEIFGRSLRLPMISLPHKVAYNQCPYISQEQFPIHIMLGHKLKQHQQYLATDALDRLNRISWNLDINVLNSDVKYPEKMEEPARIAWQACFDLVKQGMLEHGAKHFVWRIDNRGRMYPDCIVNFQGFEWIRATLNFGSPQKLTEEGAKWLQIDVANQFGLDKETWTTRLNWFKKNQAKLESLANQADKPILYAKAVSAWRNHEQEKSIEHIIGLDAISSGLQMMAILTGCKTTAKSVGLINTRRREDLYGTVRDEMQEILGVPIERDTIKYPIMTHYYGSAAVPKKRLSGLHNMGQKALSSFYAALENRLPGAEMLRKLFLSLHQEDATQYEWTLPDGFVAVVPVLQTVLKRLEIDELNHSKISWAQQVIAPKRKGDDRSLAANIIHSVDAYVAREMIRKCNFDMAPIHDCFYAHPNNMGNVTENYRKILSELAQSDILNQILEELEHPPVVKLNPDLEQLILKSQYALS